MSLDADQMRALTDGLPPGTIFVNLQLFAVTWWDRLRAWISPRYFGELGAREVRATYKESGAPWPTGLVIMSIDGQRWIVPEKGRIELWKI